MHLQKDILSALIKDNKARKIEGITPFGDIIYSEENGYGDTVYFICLIYMADSYSFADGIEKKIFFYRIEIIKSLDTSKAQEIIDVMTFLPFLPQTDDVDVLSLWTLPEDLVSAFTGRYSIYKYLSQKFGALSDNEIYGYCSTSIQHSELPFAKKVSLEIYHKDVLNDALNISMDDYTDLWKLHSKEFSTQVQKHYYGYGFELPKKILSCSNLRSLCIWNFSVDDILDFPKFVT